MVEKIAVITLAILLGLCVGSFLNVVIYRLPKGMSLVKPSSHCPNCDSKIRPYDNIPLFSFLFLGGKCRVCKAKISIRYPLVELLNTLLYFLSLCLYTSYVFPSAHNIYVFVIYCVILSCLLCVFFCDLDNMEIPDELQIVLLICGLSLLLFSSDVSSNVYGFLLGGGFFLLFSLLFTLIRKKEGLGFGDVKLMAVLGLILGLYKTILLAMISCISAAIVLSIIYLVKKEEKDKSFPFATFIVPSAVLCMIVGDAVVGWYLSLLAI